MNTYGNMIQHLQRESVIKSIILEKASKKSSGSMTLDFVESWGIKEQVAGAVVIVADVKLSGRDGYQETREYNLVMDLQDFERVFK